VKPLYVINKEIIRLRVVGSRSSKQEMVAVFGYAAAWELVGKPAQKNVKADTVPLVIVERRY
jgi:hypothetical protein